MKYFPNMHLVNLEVSTYHNSTINEPFWVNACYKNLVCKESTCALSLVIQTTAKLYRMRYHMIQNHLKYRSKKLMAKTY